MTENKMREIKIEKVVLSEGGKAEKAEKEAKLLQIITGKKAVVVKAKRRVPAFDVRPGLEIGSKVTIRKDTEPLLKRLLAAVNNKLDKKKIETNHFSFGIEEYIEIPGVEYQRELGVLGLNVSVVFSRKGKRVGLRKIKQGKVSKKQDVSKEEIINFMKQNYNLEVI